MRAAKSYGQSSTIFAAKSTDSLIAGAFKQLEAENAALNGKNSQLWSTLIDIANSLGIDTENPVVSPGKPSEVFISKIGALKARVAELEAKNGALDGRVAALVELIQDCGLGHAISSHFYDKIAQTEGYA